LLDVSTPASYGVRPYCSTKRAWIAADAGLVINPDGAANQLEGGLIHAISMTLKEQVTMEGDGITSLDWESYPILKFSEVPEISTVLVHAPNEPTLGMGECTFGPTAAAIGKADRTCPRAFDSNGRAVGRRPGTAAAGAS